MTTPTNKQLREFILTSFNESEFDLFCFDYFEGVEHLFSDGMNIQTRVLEFIRYCQRQQRVDELLVALERERPSTFPRAFPPSSPKQEPTSTSFIHEKTGLEFVYIPAGEFLFGENNFRIYLPEYWMCKTPVTFAAYQRFIQDNPEYAVPYVDEDWAEPFNWDPWWRSYPAAKADHPIVLVSWYDAVAFCKWANLHLTTEEQWEKAARGTDGRTYPWGNNEPTDKLCNFGKRVGSTTSVGSYSPQGDSPFCCVDMAGNVWEWCLNKFNDPKDITVDQSGDLRTLHGGSWDGNEAFVREMARGFGVPEAIFNDGGFRVVYQL